MLKRLLRLASIAALVSASAAAASAGECAADASPEECTESDIPADEELNISIENRSPFRVDVYYDDGEYGSFISTLEKDAATGINSYKGHTFFVTRHGVKQRSI